MRTCYITTKDNPYNPSEEFQEWFLYDVTHGYNSCGILARFAYTTDTLSEYENAIEIERAIDEVIRTDFRGVYTKIVVDEPSETQRFVDPSPKKVDGFTKLLFQDEDYRYPYDG